MMDARSLDSGLDMSSPPSSPRCEVSPERPLSWGYLADLMQSKEPYIIKGTSQARPCTPDRGERLPVPPPPQREPPPPPPPLPAPSDEAISISSPVLPTFSHVPGDIPGGAPSPGLASAALPEPPQREPPLPPPPPPPSEESAFPPNPKLQPRISLRLPRVSDRPEIKALSAKLGPRPASQHCSTIQLAEQVHHAIEKNDSDTVLRLLQDARVNPNVLRGGSTTTPLHKALAARSFEAAVFLVLSGADLEARNKTGETAIISAVRSCFPDDFVALLCELGARAHAVDFLGRSALHYAAELAPKDNTILALCGYRAALSLRDTAGYTPLHDAVLNQRPEAIARLIDCGADVEAVTSHGGKTALHLAIAKRSAHMVKVLCERGAVVDGDMGESTPLMVAITSACTDIARVLINAGASPDLPSTRGNFPLLMASALGNKEVVELLLARGADVHASSPIGNAPLHMAAQKNHIAIVRMLVGAHAPLDHTNNDGFSPLDLAAFAGHVEVVRILLDGGANPNSLGPGNQSILWRLLQKMRSGGRTGPAEANEDETSPEHTQIICLLIKAGADVTAPQGKLEITPLHEASRLGLNSIVELMLSHAGKESIEKPIWAGHTPLFFAAQGGRLETVRLLIDKHGANIFARTAANEHLLFAAAAYPEVLRFLLGLKDERAETASTRNWMRLASTSCPALGVNHQNNSGATVLHVAAGLGQSESTKLLLRRGARQFIANAVFDNLHDLKEGMNYRQGTPAGVARQRGHRRIAETIEGW